MVQKAAATDHPLLDLELLNDAAECLRTLAHPHRLRMVQLLLRGRYTVGELARRLRDPEPHGLGASAADAAVWIVAEPARWSLHVLRSGSAASGRDHRLH